MGRLAGEAKLTGESGLKGYYQVEGYRDSVGNEILVPASCVAPRKDLVPEQAERKWLVNNGSQIIGPLGADEIARRLFAQELDFDSECFVDGTGEPSQIRSAGIFSGTGAEDAELWLFDQETIHGPMTEAFLKAALLRGAIGPEAYLCERSTIHGWKKVSEWAGAQPVSAPAPEAAEETVAEAAPATVAEEPIDLEKLAESVTLIEPTWRKTA